MTTNTSYITQLFEIFIEIINTSNTKDIEIKIINLIDLCYKNKEDLNKLISKTVKQQFVFDGNDNIRIGSLLYGNTNLSEKTSLEKLFDFDTKSHEDKANKYIQFIILIEKIIKIFDNSYVKNLLDLNKDSIIFFNDEINNDFLKANEQILKKNREIFNYKDKPLNKKNNKVDDYLSKTKLTKIENLEILQKNKPDFKQIIEDLILNINDKINFYTKKFIDLLELIKSNIQYRNSPLIKLIQIFDDKFLIKYLNNYFNYFIKNIKKSLNEKINDNEYLKILFDHFKKTIKDFKIPELIEVIENLEKKYENFKKKFFDSNLTSIDEKDLLKYDELFNTNNGEWINDSKKDEKIKEYKKKYDELLIDSSPDKIEVSKKYEKLFNYSEKIKLIQEKIKNKEKIQKKEVEFITQFNYLIELIRSENPDDEEFIKEIDKVEKAFDKSGIKSKIDQEIEDKRIIKDKIDEKDRDQESVYFEDFLAFFKFPLKIFTYGGILFAFIILFLSFLSLIILIYDVIKNIITLFVNSANSTNNLSIDYITKSIIKCSKDNYTNDRFYILTVQKQNLTIFNLGAYTLYLLIIYLITYFVLVFYSTQLNYKFVGTVYDIDNHFVYLFIILFLIVYSFIHLLIFKFVFKPYVYVPYKTIDEEEKNIDKMIAKFIIVKNNDGKIIKFNDFFDLLYDASKIEELSNYFLEEIKNENHNGCLEQKIIIYNLYEYLRQYVLFDDEFKRNFKLYCSTDEENKPKYENDDKITFISMLKNNEIKIISNFHEELNFINNLEDKNIEFYNKLNIEVSNKIKEINKTIITHNKTSLPFFITIIYIVIIFLFNFIFIYLIIKQIKTDKTEAFHEYIIKASDFLNTYIYDKLLKFFKIT
jgi:hypothetical protein